MIIKDKRYYIYPQEDDKFLDSLQNWNINNNNATDDKYLRSVDETLQAKHRLYEPWKLNYYVLELMKLLE